MDFETNTSLPTEIDLQSTKTMLSINCDVWFIFILYTVVAGVLCALGLVGNTMSIAVLRRDTISPVTSYQLEALAVADSVFLLLWLVHYAVRYALSFYQIGAGDLSLVWIYVRVYTFPLLYMGQTATIWLTVIIAFNRYMAVCLPYKVRWSAYLR